MLFTHPNKSHGPDGLQGRVLKVGANHVGHIFTSFFQLIVNTHSIPRSWKISTIIPIPKKPSACASAFNDFRPVALTSVVAKCIERIVSDQLISSVADRMDPLQLSYKAKRGVEANAIQSDF